MPTLASFVYWPILVRLCTPQVRCPSEGFLGHSTPIPQLLERSPQRELLYARLSQCRRVHPEISVSEYRLQTVVRVHVEAHRIRHVEDLPRELQRSALPHVPCLVKSR